MRGQLLPSDAAPERIRAGRPRIAFALSLVAAFSGLTACNETAAAPADACGCLTTPTDGGDADAGTTAVDADLPIDVSSVAGGMRPHCDNLFVDLSADHTTLVPPPLEVTVTATGSGSDVSAACTWQVGPAEVCVPGNGPGHVRKTGHGTCSVVCTTANGTCGALDLQGKAQTVIYVVGGDVAVVPAPPGAAADVARISRLRVGDGQWDVHVAYLPEFRVQPAVAILNDFIYVLGGQTGGDYTGAQFWDVFFATCEEAVITPLHLKREIGCRSVRRLDLRTGVWDSPFAWPHPRADLGWRQLGDKVYLFGGQSVETAGDTAVPELLWIADLALGAVTAPKLKIPQAFLDADATFHWPAILAGGLAGLPLVFHAGKTWLVSATGEVVVEKDIGWPCTEKSPHAVFRFPGATDDLFVLNNGNPKGANCPKCPYAQKLADGTTAPWCVPMRYHDKQWSHGKPMPFAPVIEGPDALYAFAPDATYRLATPDGAWLPVLPPLPYPRYGFAAVAVTQ